MMYPDVPYLGISWPITQHAGVLSERTLDGLLQAGLQCKGDEVHPKLINEYIVKTGILTANYRSDSRQIDAWRDYQQILSEFGLIYSTRLSKVIKLTPVASAYLNKTLIYKELITLQVLRYQYPNGHKSQLNSALLDSLEGEPGVDTFTELQAKFGILLRPAVLIWMVLDGLWKNGQLPVLSIDELQRCVVRCLRHEDTEACINHIIDLRAGSDALSLLPRARRNMADWIKILSQTLLFTTNESSDTLSFSSYSIRFNKLVHDICVSLSDTKSFWTFDSDGYKQSWFDFYGNYDDNIKYIIKEK